MSEPKDGQSPSAGERAYHGIKGATGPAKLASRLPGVGPLVSLGVLVGSAASAVLSGPKQPSSEGYCPKCHSVSWTRKRHFTRDVLICTCCGFTCDTVGTGTKLVKGLSTFARDFAAAAHADAVDFLPATKVSR